MPLHGVGRHDRPVPNASAAGSPNADRALRQFRWWIPAGALMVASGVLVAVLATGAGSVAAAVFLCVFGAWWIVMGVLLRRKVRRSLARYQRAEGNR